MALTEPKLNIAVKIMVLAKPHSPLMMYDVNVAKIHKPIVFPPFFF